MRRALLWGAAATLIALASIVAYNYGYEWGSHIWDYYFY